MRIAVLSETDKAESRVAATPETVKKYIGLGADVVVQAGAGVKAGVPDAEYEAAGAVVVATAKEAVKDADIVLKVRRPGRGRARGYKPGALVIGIMDPYGQDAALKALADAEVSAFAMELMPRITRAQVMDVLSSPGEPRRLPRGDRRRRRVRPRHADDDDRRRHRAGRPRLRHGRRRRRPSGHRHRPPPRRGGDRDRRAPGRQGAGREPRRQVRRGRGRGVQAGRDGRRLRQGNVAEYQAKQAALVADAHRQAGHRHHDGADPGPPRAEARLAGHGRIDEAGLGHHRSRGRARRQLRSSPEPARWWTINGVKIVGHLNVPGRLAATASSLYARNLFAFVETLIDKETKALAVKWDDELVQGDQPHPRRRRRPRAFQPKA